MKHWIGYASLALVLFQQSGSPPQDHPRPTRPGDGELVPPPPPELDAHDTITTDLSITITGRANGSNFVEVSTGHDVFQVPVTGNAFSADVPLGANRTNGLYFTGVRSGVRGAPVTTVVTHDQEEPILFIDAPAEVPAGAEVTTATVDVAGRVGDRLLGLMGMSVVVNNSQSDFVAFVDVGVGPNGSYVATNVPLLPSGTPTVLTVTATDKLGNVKTQQRTVTRVDIPPGSPRMEIIGGNQQSGSVRDTLAKPLLVHVMRGDGADFPGKVLEFEVTRSDGRLAETPSGEGAPRLQVRTDQDGLATVYWTLGTDAGCGNNRVTATSLDIVGSVFFCASATPVDPIQIAVGGGDNQKAEVGTPAPQALTVFVSDGINPVADEPVVFTVIEGGGKVNGQSLVVLTTDVTGHAQVNFTLGPQPGINRLSATFKESPEQAVFTAVGVKRVAGTPTTYLGVVQDNSGRPIQGAEIELAIGPSHFGPVTTDVQGQFRIENITTSGAGHVHVHGDSAFHVGGVDGEDVPLGTYPGLEYATLVVPEVENSLPTPVLLPPLDPINAETFVATAEHNGAEEDLVLKIKRLVPVPPPNGPLTEVELFAGLEFRVAKDTLITLPSGVQIGPGHPGSVTLALNQVHFDEIPMPMPDGAAPPFAWTLKPGGATFDPPIQVTLPNMAGLPAGAGMYFLNFDHDVNRFDIVASGRVSEDGQLMVSDEGTGIAKAGWGGFCPPYPRSGTVSGGANQAADAVTKTDNNPNDPCADGLTDPIYLFSGELYEEAIDLRIKGRGMDFVWSRKYRSRIDPGDPRADTPQGKSWDFSYNQRIAQQGPDILVCDGNSRADVYKLQPNGKWRKQSLFSELSQNPDTSFTLLFPDKAKWNFHALDASPDAGRIESIVDRNGNTISFSYVAGRLGTVHDTLGRDILIAYNPQGRIASVTDFIGRQVVYEYYVNAEVGGSDGDLKSVRSPIVVGTPTNNDFPSGKTTLYTYSEGLSDERLNHNLLTVTDPKGQAYVQNVYATTTDDQDIEFDHVVRETWGNPGDIIDLVYVPQTPAAQNGFAVVKTILNDRVGNVKELFFNALNVQVIRRDYTGRANPDQPTTETTNRPTGKLRSTDPDYFETRQEWNNERTVTCRIEADGSSMFTFHERDLNRNASVRSGGNVRVRAWVSPASAGLQKQSIAEIFEYDEDLGSGCCGFNFVTRQVDGRGNVTTHTYDAAGNRIQTVHLMEDLENAGDDIVKDFGYNAFGQQTLRRLPDNGSGHRREDTFTYYSTGPQNGYLQSAVIDATGPMALALATTYEYDAVGNIVRMIDPRGNDTLTTFNALDQIVRVESRAVELPPGSMNLVRYERDLFYDANDNVVRLDVQNVDDLGSLAPNSYLTTLTEYEILDNPIRLCQESGSFDVPRGMMPQLTCAGLPAAEFVTTEYDYDANRNRTLVRMGEAVEGRQPTNVVRTLHDERDLVFRVIRAEGDPDPSTDQYDYDKKGNVVRFQQGLESAPRVTLTAYDGFDRRVRVTDPMGNVTTTAYDSNHSVTRILREGQLQDVTGSTGNVRLGGATYAYDALDRLIRTEVDFFERETGNDLQGGQMLGKAITTIAYSPNSQVLEVINDNLHATTTAYDRANRPSTVTDAKGNMVANTYDANSNVVSVLETEKPDLGGPDELFTTNFDYDAHNRLVKTVDNVGNETKFFHDSRDNRVLSEDALTNRIRYQYDSLDRLLSTTYDMDADGPDGDGPDIVTHQTWDDSIRLTAQIDDNGNATRYAYDALGRRIVTQAADGTIHQVGMGADWLLGSPAPNLSGFNPGHDVHDNPVTTLDANGSMVTSTFDLLDRVTIKMIVPGPGVSPQTTRETFSYDGLSSLIEGTSFQGSNQESIVERTHDSIGNVVREELTVLPGTAQTTLSSYDGVGNMLRCTYPSGRVIACAFDELERKKTIVDSTSPGSPEPIATYAFVGPARVARKDLGNNTRCTYTYDGITGIPNPTGDFGVKRIIETAHVSDPDGTPVEIDTRSYTWDRLYNKTKRIDERIGGPGLGHEYSYDPTSRLTSTTARDGHGLGAVVRSTSYAFDGVGNRCQVIGTPDPGDYTCDGVSVCAPPPSTPDDCPANQYSETPFDVREYDLSGNLVQIDGGLASAHLITYDYTNRMVSHSDLGGTAEYIYDALGRRIERIVNPGTPVTTRYFYSGWCVAEEQDSAGTELASYAYGLYVDEVLEMRRAGLSYFYHADDQFDVTSITNESGATIERYDYEDYGSPYLLDASGGPISSSTIDNPYAFQGRSFDEETGWYHYRTRYLDPRSGRFTARDRIGTWGDLLAVGNPYAFVASNPWSRVDPMGTDARSSVKAAIRKHRELLRQYERAELDESSYIPSGLAHQAFFQAGHHMDIALVMADLSVEKAVQEYLYALEQLPLKEIAVAGLGARRLNAVLEAIPAMTRDALREGEAPKWTDLLKELVDKEDFEFTMRQLEAAEEITEPLLTAQGTAAPPKCKPAATTRDLIEFIDFLDELNQSDDGDEITFEKIVEYSKGAWKKGSKK